MRVRCVCHLHPERGCLQYWVGSRAEAAAKRAEIRRKHGRNAEIWTLILDIPTDKVGLLRWLNSHFDTNNG